MKSIASSLTTSCFFLLFAATTGCTGESASSETIPETTESEITAPCDGTACASLPHANIVTHAGIAAWKDRLYWFQEGENAEGTTVYTLQSCALPACTTAVPGPTVEGFPQDLKASKDALVFIELGDEVLLRRFDGNSLATLRDDLEWAPEHLRLATDGDEAFVTGERQTRLRKCIVSTGACTRVPGDGFLDLALTPTRVILGSADTLWYAPRTDITLERNLSGGTQSFNMLLTSGEDLVSTQTFTGGNDGTVSTIRKNFDELAKIPGWTTSAVEGATGYWYTTQGGKDGGGVYRVTKSLGLTRTVATHQWPRGIVVTDSRVFWLHVRAGEEAIRFAKL